MRLGSFCTGIGGLDIAAERVFGAEPVWFAEYEKAPSLVLARHWPDVPNHGDIKKTDWASVEPVDIVTAGYPCQPFSTAGKREGTDDPRHLWPSIRDAVRVLRPRIVVLENVRGHLSLGFGQVLADLAGLGFNAEWGVFRSSDIGAPHRRGRLFVVANSRDSAVVGERPRAEPRQRDSAASDTDRDAAADSNDANGFPVDNHNSASSPRRQAGGFANGRGAGSDRTSDRQRTWGRYWPAIDRWERITGTVAPHPVDHRGRLNPELPEWMMGYPAGWVTAVDGVSRSSALKAIGNAVQPQTGAAAVAALAQRASSVAQEAA